MVNLLGMGFIILVWTLLTILGLIILHPMRKYSHRLSNRLDKISDGIFWGFWLRFVIEDCLVALISVFCDNYSIKASEEPGTSLETEHVSMPFKIINIAVLAFFGIALLAIPFFVAIYYPMNFDRMKDPEFE